MQLYTHSYYNDLAAPLQGLGSTEVNKFISKEVHILQFSQHVHVAWHPGYGVFVFLVEKCLSRYYAYP
jgi:hypothetical protein